MSDATHFEMLCAEILVNEPEYSTLAPQGIGRRDGGKDAIGRTLGEWRKADEDGQSVSWLTEGQVFHFSLRKDVTNKIREDLANTRYRELKPKLVVFATSRRLTPGQQDREKKFCREEYGWPLEILDQEWLRVRLDTGWQSVRKRYLGLDYDCTVFRNLDDLLDRPTSRRYLSRHDLESGAYFRRASLHETISKDLEQDRVALLVGQPGHGKTALALAWAWEWQRQDPRRTVFYLSARNDDDWRRWEQDIHAFDHAYGCFIVDDAHVQTEAVSSLIQSRGNVQEARLLVVSRDLAPSLRGDEDNYLDDLSAHTLRVEADAQEWHDIVCSLAHRPDMAAGLGDPARILERCGGDLHLLRHLLTAWEKLPLPRPTLAEVPEDAVDDDVLARYLGKNPGPAGQPSGALLSLAALGQYEIPAESVWLASRPGWQELLQEGWAERGPRDCYGMPVEFSDFFHATPARLLLDAAHRRGILGRSVKEHTLACLRDYLERPPGNAVAALLALYRNDAADIQRELLSADYASRVLAQLPETSWQGMADAAWILHALWRVEGSPQEGGAARTYWDNFKAKLGPKLPTIGLSLELVAASLSRIARLDKDYVLQAWQRLDYAELGRQSRDAALATVKNILGSAISAGVAKEKMRAFCSGLDFAELGRRSCDVGLSTVGNFLGAASRTGVEKDELKAFCSGLDFAELGRRSCDMGLSTVGTFLGTASRAGVEKDELKAFCSGLDFAELGRRSCDVGLSVVMTFLHTASRAGVEKDELLAFTKQLDFSILGEKVTGAPMSTIYCFMQDASLAGVGKEQLQAFAGKLNWLTLGRELRADEDGKRGAYLAELTWAAKNIGVSCAQARALVTGWGWEDIRAAVANHLSPDGLAALLDLLRKRCDYSDDHLANQELDIRQGGLWLRAFSEHPAGKMGTGSWQVQVRYFDFALTCLENELRSRPLFYSFFDLRQWNILAHNLNLAAPARLKSLYWPALKQLSEHNWHRLFSQTDIKNLSIFFSRFGPEGLFAGRPPPFQPPSATLVLTLAHQGTVLDTAHLLVNLSWVNGASTAVGLVRHWQKGSAELSADFPQADLHTLSYLGWAMLLACPEGDWLDKGNLAQAWAKRLSDFQAAEQGEAEDWLGLAGLYALSGRSLPFDHLTSLTKIQFPQPLENRLAVTFGEPDSELIRRLAGLLALFRDRLSTDFRNRAHAALAALPALSQIPFQNVARDRVLAALEQV